MREFVCGNDSYVYTVVHVHVRNGMPFYYNMHVLVSIYLLNTDYICILQ